MNGVPKVELHCHLEGAAAPELIGRLADRNGINLPKARFTIDGGFSWDDFAGFLDAYDLASSVISRCWQDHRHRESQRSHPKKSHRR